MQRNIPFPAARPRTARQVLTRIVLAVAVAVMAPSPAPAQTASIPFGDTRADLTQPIEIVSDSFTLSQDRGEAEFVGNVVVGQGTLRLSADRIHVTYVMENGKPTSAIDRMVATGNVTLVAGTEAAEAQKAIYSVKDQTIRMEGDVLLTQGPNALSGQSMVYDLRSGSARIAGRVRTILNPGRRPGAKK